MAIERLRLLHFLQQHSTEPPPALAADAVAERAFHERFTSTRLPSEKIYVDNETIMLVSGLLFTVRASDLGTDRICRER